MGDAYGYCSLLICLTCLPDSCGVCVRLSAQCDYKALLLEVDDAYRTWRNNTLVMFGGADSYIKQKSAFDFLETKRTTMKFKSFEAKVGWLRLSSRGVRSANGTRFSTHNLGSIYSPDAFISFLIHLFHNRPCCAVNMDTCLNPGFHFWAHATDARCHAEANRTGRKVVGRRRY